MRLHLGRPAHCPLCSTAPLYPSQLRSLTDRLCRLLLLRPLRCHRCGERTWFFPLWRHAA